MVEEGKIAPDFSLPNADGELIKLSSFKGKNIVLYFIPKIIHLGVRSRPAIFVTQSRIMMLLTRL